MPVYKVLHSRSVLHSKVSHSRSPTPSHLSGPCRLPGASGLWSRMYWKPLGMGWVCTSMRVTGPFGTWLAPFDGLILNLKTLSFPSCQGWGWGKWGIWEGLAPRVRQAKVSNWEQVKCYALHSSPTSPRSQPCFLLQVAMNAPCPNARLKEGHCQSQRLHRVIRPIVLIYPQVISTKRQRPCLKGAQHSKKACKQEMIIQGWLGQVLSKGICGREEEVKLITRDSGEGFEKAVVFPGPWTTHRLHLGRENGKLTASRKEHESRCGVFCN